MIENVWFGDDVEIKGDENLVNIYGCEVGSNSTIGPFVEIQKGVSIGSRCKISSHTFICDGVTIGNHCFIGHGVMFTNDIYPTTFPRPNYLVRTQVGDNVSVGSGVTILPVWIGDGAIIGAGSTVVHDVPAFSIVAGNPAKTTHQFSSLEERDEFIKYHYNNRL